MAKSRNIKVTKNKPQHIELSKSIKCIDSNVLNISRKSNSLKNITLKTKYSNCLPISDKKFQNLLSLLQYIPYENHDFFKNLPHSSRIPDIHHDLLSNLEDD